MARFHGMMLSVAPWAPYTQSDFGRFKRWGLNSVCTYLYWGSYLEPIEELAGNYGTANGNVTGSPTFEEYGTTFVAYIQNIISLARANGMYPFIGVQTHFSPPPGLGEWWVGWCGKYGSDYVNFNNVQDLSGSYGRDRYINMLKWLVQTFPDVGINAWHFPYHQQGDIAQLPDRVDAFFNTTQPALLSAIRSLNPTLPVFLNPTQQGAWTGADNYTRATGALAYQRNFNDPNVTYGYDSHDGNSTWSGICRSGNEWNYDMVEFNDQMQTGVDFLQSNPNARLGCIEFVGLGFDHLSTPPSPISQSRLDWCRTHFEWAKKYDADWWYWIYLPPPYTQGDCPTEIDGSDTKLTDMITEYAPITPPTPLTLPFADSFNALDPKWQKINGVWNVP